MNYDIIDRKRGNMFFRKKLRKLEKQLKNDDGLMLDSEDNAVISINAPKQEQIFSEYDYDSGEDLNQELSDFVTNKAKFVPINKEIRLRLYTEKITEKINVESAIKNNFKKKYIETQNEIKKNTLFALAMFIVGLFSLAVLLLMHSFFYNVYTEVILEIVTWVFIWEAVDAFFLKRLSLKKEATTYLKLYSAEIEVIKLEDIKKKT